MFTCHTYAFLLSMVSIYLANSSIKIAAADGTVCFTGHRPCINVCGKEMNVLFSSDNVLVTVSDEGCCMVDNPVYIFFTLDRTLLARFANIHFTKNTYRMENAAV